MRQPQTFDPPAHLAALIQSSDDTIVSKDLDGIIMSWNPAAERMCGFTQDEAVGRSIYLIIPEDRKSEEEFVLGRVKSGEGVNHYETVRRRKDATFLDVSLTVAPIKDSTGKIVGASKVARDITEK